MSQPSARSRALSTCVASTVLLVSAGAAAAQSAGGIAKIPVTTASASAKQEYLKGRTLGENLRAHDSRQFLQAAAATDPSFALAHYSLALSAPTAKDFFQHLRRAVSLADKASEGERLMILGLQAGANADPKLQREYYERLATTYPRDERAHFLLGGAYFGQQEYGKAVSEYKKSVELAPDYAPAYNLLGYAHRAEGQYQEAEQAFKKYIQLIPNDPNPYDSYAELLMKMGRFDESIAMYRKALQTDPNFSNSHFGIASNLMYQGKHDAARAESRRLHEAARNDGDRRLALFSSAVTYADEGKFDLAVKQLREEYAVAEKINDAAAMSADLTAIGDVLLEAGKPKEAQQQYARALELQEKSDLSSEVKENARLVQHFHLGRVAAAAGDYAAAGEHAAKFLQGAPTKKNDIQIRQAHDLAGSIALGQKEFARAVNELSQGNQQDPYTLYRLALAYQGKGDQAKASKLFEQAADQNTLPTLNYAFVRLKAKKMKA
jgi:tetratricopeptide (TPR) repeat protein